MGELFAVETKITYPEYQKGAWFRYLHIGKSLWPSLILVMLVFAGFVSFALGDLITLGFNAPWETWFMVAIWILFLPALWAINEFRFSKRYRDRWLHPRRYSFYKDEVRMEILDGSGQDGETYAYSKLRRVYEQKDAFYLDRGNIAYLILPKRNSDDAEQKRLAALLVEKLGKKYIQCY
jgi:hypothetical protein